MNPRFRSFALLLPLLCLAFAGVLRLALRDVGPDGEPWAVRRALERLDHPEWRVRRLGEAELARLDRSALSRVLATTRPRASAQRIAVLEWLLRRPVAGAPHLRLQDGRRVAGALVREEDGWVVVEEGQVRTIAHAEVRAVETCDVSVAAPCLREPVEEAHAQEAGRWFAALCTAERLENRRRAAQRFVEEGREPHLTWLEETVARGADDASPGACERQRWLEWARRELHWKLYGVYE